MESFFWGESSGRGLGLDVEVRCCVRVPRWDDGLFADCGYTVGSAWIGRQPTVIRMLALHCIVRLGFPSSTQLLASSLAPPKRPASPTPPPTHIPPLLSAPLPSSFSSNIQAQSHRPESHFQTHVPALAACSRLPRKSLAPRRRATCRDA